MVCWLSVYTICSSYYYLFLEICYSPTTFNNCPLETIQLTTNCIPWILFRWNKILKKLIRQNKYLFPQSNIHLDWVNVFNSHYGLQTNKVIQLFSYSETISLKLPFFFLQLTPVKKIPSLWKRFKRLCIYLCSIQL